MTAVLAFCRFRPVRQGAWLVALLAMLAATPSRAADTITVVLDQATIAKLPDGVATLVIGNPLIADVSVEAGGLLVITGKGYGSTNMIVLDQAGKVLAERNIQVLGPQDAIVVVYRGVNRESYSCAPLCERRITLGDTPEFFDQTLGQAGNRAARAQAH